MSEFLENFGGLLIVIVIFVMWVDLQESEPSSAQATPHAHHAAGF